MKVKSKVLARAKTKEGKEILLYDDGRITGANADLIVVDGLMDPKYSSMRDKMARKMISQGKSKEFIKKRLTQLFSEA